MPLYRIEGLNSLQEKTTYHFVSFDVETAIEQCKRKHLITIDALVIEHDVPQSAYIGSINDIDIAMHSRPSTTDGYLIYGVSGAARYASQHITKSDVMDIIQLYNVVPSVKITTDSINRGIGWHIGMARKFAMMGGSFWARDEAEYLQYHMEQ